MLGLTNRRYSSQATTKILKLDKRARLFILVCAHPVLNVPPLLNVSLELGRRGISSVVLGYHKEGLPINERIGPHSRIFRLRLASRLIPLAPLRRIIATVEFLWRARQCLRRLEPDVLIAFNDPAVILLGESQVGMQRVGWLLEYPEFERFGILQRLLMKLSSRYWARGDIFVAPTAQRLAVHCAVRPGLLSRKTVVIQNSPKLIPLKSTVDSENGRKACAWIGTARERGLLIIIHAGAIGNRYGIDAVIHAVAATPGTALLILGPDNPVAKADINGALQAHAECDRITWIKGVPYQELHNILALCDAGFVHYVGDSINTRFSAPGKLYDYLRAGLPHMTEERPRRRLRRLRGIKPVKPDAL